MSELVIFETGGEQVAFDPAAQMWSLTAMHAAAGAPKHKDPYTWLRQKQSQEFMAALAERLNLIQDQVYEDAADRLNPIQDRNYEGLVQTRQGRFGGGTWAHWQIAAAYAHYLNPAFYLQWNEWAMAHRTGQAPAAVEQRLAALESQLAELRAAPPVPTLTFRRTVEELHYTGPLHPQARAILAIFEAAQGGPPTAAEVISALRRSGVPITAPTQVRVRLRRMAQRRQLRKVAHGTYETPR